MASSNDVLDCLKLYARSRGVDVSESMLWDACLGWLKAHGRLLWFGKNGPKPAAPRTFRCGQCNDTGSVAVDYKDGDPVMGECSCRRKRL